MERVAPGSRKAARVFVCAGFGRGAMGEDGQRARVSQPHRGGCIAARSGQTAGRVADLRAIVNRLFFPLLYQRNNERDFRSRLNCMALNST